MSRLTDLLKQPKVSTKEKVAMKTLKTVRRR